ncbi:MAG: lamin tail domain-containing protein [Anaerolineaceae bacterium]|nr:lamin tail domain-containing protein [Anaerolineaceae bacterium]
MRAGRRLFPYILLNILVSAITTLLVLWIWDLTHQTDIPALEQLPIAATSIARVTLPPAAQPLIEIENVFGVGITESEMVRLVRVQSGDLWITGWKLEDEDGNSFVFPQLNFVEGSIDVFTRPGINAPTALYWKLNRPVWRIGETVSLRDPEGTLRAKYLIR